MRDAKAPSAVASVESALQAAWFRQDGVHLLQAAHFAPLVDIDGEPGAAGTPLELVFEERFRWPVPLIPFLRPRHGIVIARTRPTSTSGKKF